MMSSLLFRCLLGVCAIALLYRFLPVSTKAEKNASPPLDSVPAFEEYCGAGCDLSVPGLLSDDRQTCGGHSHNYTL